MKEMKLIGMNMMMKMEKMKDLLNYRFKSKRLLKKRKLKD